jgi:hypothetical protein
MDEYDLHRFRSGDIYDVPAQLASLLIISGHAEPVTTRFTASEAADYSKPQKL